MIINNRNEVVTRNEYLATSAFNSSIVGGRLMSFGNTFDDDNNDSKYVLIVLARLYASEAGELYTIALCQISLMSSITSAKLLYLLPSKLVLTVDKSMGLVTILM